MHAQLGLIIVFCGALLASACSTDGSTDDGTHSQYSGECGPYCANVAGAGCEAAGEADCMAACETSAALAAGSESADCKAVWAGYLSCMSSAKLECNGTDVSRLPCRADYDRIQNYCVHGFTPAEPCLDNPVADLHCEGGTPHAKLCRGDAESGCVLGGTANHADFYCCPG